MLALFGFEALGEIQYKPQASPIRHELSFGSFFHAYPFPAYQPKKEGGGKRALSFFSDLALRYSLYFPETERLLPKAYRNIFIFGAAAGAEGISHTGSCKNVRRSLMYYLGLKGRFFYAGHVSPFFEYGLAKASCFRAEEDGLSSKQSSLKIKKYISLGLNLSGKIFSRRSVYSLDQDHGLNDISLSFRCSRFPEAENSGKKLSFCQTGLSLLF